MQYVASMYVNIAWLVIPPCLPKEHSLVQQKWILHDSGNGLSLVNQLRADWRKNCYEAWAERKLFEFRTGQESLHGLWVFKWFFCNQIITYISFHEINMKLYIILFVWCAQNYFHESVLELALLGMLAQWIKSFFSQCCFSPARPPERRWGSRLIYSIAGTSFKECTRITKLGASSRTTKRTAAPLPQQGLQEQEEQQVQHVQA